jgi:hypothetical protein
MKRGNQHDGNAIYAKDRRTRSFEHRSRPFQRRLFLDEVVRRVLERVLGGPRVKTKVFYTQGVGSDVSRKMG